MALHTVATAWLPGGVLSSQRRLHAVSRGLRRILQPETTVGPLHYGQHNGLVDGLQTDRENQR
jgi:hypothetical protein